MTHRIVAAAVRLLLVALVAAAFAFALVVRSRGGNDGAWPATHRNFGAATCATCHGRRPGPGRCRQGGSSARRILRQ